MDRPLHDTGTKKNVVIHAKVMGHRRGGAKRFDHRAGKTTAATAIGLVDDLDPAGFMQCRQDRVSEGLPLIDQDDPAQGRFGREKRDQFSHGIGKQVFAIEGAKINRQPDVAHRRAECDEALLIASAIAKRRHLDVEANDVESLATVPRPVRLAGLRVIFRHQIVDKGDTFSISAMTDQTQRETTGRSTAPANTSDVGMVYLPG